MNATALSTNKRTKKIISFRILIFWFNTRYPLWQKPNSQQPSIHYNFSIQLVVQFKSNCGSNEWTLHPIRFRLWSLFNVLNCHDIVAVIKESDSNSFISVLISWFAIFINSMNNLLITYSPVKEFWRVIARYWNRSLQESGSVHSFIVISLFEFWSGNNGMNKSPDAYYIVVLIFVPSGSTAFATFYSKFL